MTMKAQIGNVSATTSRRLGRGLAGLMVVLTVAIASIGLMRNLSFSGPSQPVAPAVSTNVYAPLDQHDRHAATIAGSTSVDTPLDQYDRHAPIFPHAETPLRFGGQ